VIEPELEASPKVYPTENPDGTVELLVGVIAENIGAAPSVVPVNVWSAAAFVAVSTTLPDAAV